MKPTEDLRYLTTTLDMCDGPGGDHKMALLQQFWVSEDGTGEWRILPEHEVDFLEWESMTKKANK